MDQSTEPVLTPVPLWTRLSIPVSDNLRPHATDRPETSSKTLVTPMDLKSLVLLPYGKTTETHKPGKGAHGRPETGQSTFKD